MVQAWASPRVIDWEQAKVAMRDLGLELSLLGVLLD